MKILFCHTGLSTFVKSDLDFLKLHYDVTEYAYTVEKGKVMKIRNIFSSLFFSLKHVRRVDVVYGWFGGFHCFWAVLLAKILHKKSIIIVGGYDASYIPSIKYGVFYNKGMLLWCVKKIYQWATYICPVDESLVRSTNYYADPTGKGYKTGILNHMELEESKIKVIPTGYDSEFWEPDFSIVREGVIALASVTNDNTFVLKGFDLLVECAKMLPEVSFTFAGFSPEMVAKTKPNLPKNISLLSFQTPEQSKILFQNHKVFVLPSLTEGLPNTLCEAMLCGCIPIGANAGAIPYIIDKNGFILKRKDVDELKSVFLQAMACDQKESLRTFARKSILDRFSIEKRAESLFKIIDTLV